VAPPRAPRRTRLSVRVDDGAHCQTLLPGDVRGLKYGGGSPVLDIDRVVWLLLQEEVLQTSSLRDVGFFYVAPFAPGGTSQAPTSSLTGKRL
jgi:hypothetical protein